MLALGCDLRRFDAYRPSPGAARLPESAPLVLWNQRWSTIKLLTRWPRLCLPLPTRDMTSR